MKRGRYVVQMDGLDTYPEFAATPGEASDLAHRRSAENRSHSVEVIDRRTRIPLMRLPQQDRCHPFGWTPAQCIAWLAICCTFP